MLHDIKDETFFEPPKSQGWCKNEYCQSFYDNSRKLFVFTDGGTKMPHLVNNMCGF